MHVPNGFFDTPSSVVLAGAAALAIGGALRGARRDLDDKSAPMAGLVATFIFAGQMVNFPVGAGTSGHLIGGALAVALVGPWTGLLCLSVVVIVQSLLLADGGITAIGINITLLAVIPALVAVLVFRSCFAFLPQRQGLVAPVAGLAGFLSVVATATVFALLYAVGGIAPVDPALLLKTMVGWHVLIGLGEAVITALVVRAILGVRPDLVWVARPMREQRPLEIREGGTR